ncbi:hypothetical protein ACFOMD_14620 [Sphingoaurantiacus capsulatus]|uniref:Uncharacterized protein n=1 Tax=Sphingoaurantiacus capsulatus TaxID=1771310 RepID=A0ABV7XET3_9SPHN
MAKQKRSNSSTRNAYASARRFASDNRRALGLAAAGAAGAAALLIGRHYRGRRSADAS